MEKLIPVELQKVLISVVPIRLLTVVDVLLHVFR